MMFVIIRIRQLLRKVGLAEIFPTVIIIALISSLSELIFIWIVGNLFSGVSGDRIMLHTETGESIINFYFVSVLLLAVLVAKLAVTYGIAYVNQKVTERVSGKIVLALLTTPYSSGPGDKKSDIAAEAVSYVDRFSSEFVSPLFRMVVSSLTLFVILVYGLTVIPYVLAPMFLFFIIFYMILFKIIKKALGSSGAIVSQNYNRRVEFLGQTSDNYKYIKATRSEFWFSNLFNVIAKRLSFHIAKQVFLGDASRPIVEFLFVGAMFVIVFFSQTIESFGTVSLLETVGFLSLIAFRSLPQAQQIFASKAQMKFSITILEKLEKRLSILGKTDAHIQVSDASFPRIQGLRINAAGLGFSHGDNWVFRDLSFSFETGDLVLIRGRSGSGKSTLLDLILKLQAPTLGSLNITCSSGDVLRQLDQAFCYVPQKIFLLNDTIARNVAFDKKIDEAQVQKCLKLANLYEEVCFLSSGMDTIIGDGGLPLSGGQEQRLAIARALYSDRPILVMDEPTSALDVANETLFLERLQIIRQNRIIIIVSHSNFDENIFSWKIDLG